jgi:hypothetical protein
MMTILLPELVFSVEALIFQVPRSMVRMSLTSLPWSGVWDLA